MKYLIPFLLSLLAVTSLHAEAQTEISIKIGVIAPLSGDFAPLGGDCKKGVLIALALSEQKDVSYVFGDARADPKLALQEYERIKQSDNPIAFVVLRGPLGMALAPVAGREGIPLVGGIGNPHFVVEGKTSFQAWPTATIEGAYLAEQLIKSGERTASVVTLEDDWTSVISEGFRMRYLALGGKILLDEQVLPTEQMFSQIVTKIKSLKPAATFLNLGIAQTPQFLKELKIQKVSTQKYSNFWAATPEAIKAAGEEASRGVAYTEMNLSNPEFMRGLRKLYGEGASASGATYSCFIGSSFLLQGLSHGAKPKTPQEFFNTLLKLSELRVSSEHVSVVNRQIQLPVRLRVIGQ